MRRHHNRKRVLGALAGGVVVLALGPPGPAVSAGPGDPDRPVHSSDLRAGPRLDAADVAGPRRRSALVPDAEVEWDVAPGLHYARWSVAEPQGAVTVHVLTATWEQPGLSLDLAGGAEVTERAAVSRWVHEAGGVAGVNGDFFDIRDTGAALGVAVRGRRLLQAPRSGWNLSFVISAAGNPGIREVGYRGRVLRRHARAIPVSGLNTPHVPPGGIGAYTASWGTSPGTRVTEGARTVRQVLLRDGRVRANTARLSAGRPIAGTLLVGRGDGATRLRGLRVGTRARAVHVLTEPLPRVAVSGSEVLVRDGRPVGFSDPELHPRTAIGIDWGARVLHLVAVDGRSESSSGMTLAQLGTLMDALGDDRALNLDGGGSSTMVAGDPAGVVAVRNAPSDGGERAVPNGLVLRSGAG